LKAELGRLLALFLAAVIIRLAYIASTPLDAAISSTDAWGYHRLALNMDQGHGFSLRRQAPYVPESVRTPLYPAFLLLVRRSLGSSPRVAAIVQAVLDGCTAVLTWWLARQVGGRRAGRVAALLYAFSPTQVRYVNQLLTETLLSFLLTLTVCALTRYIRSASAWNSASVQSYTPSIPRQSRRAVPWIVLVALLTGLAALCKPNVQFLPLIWLLVIALVHRHNWRRGWTEAGLMMITVLCVLAPWVVRNQLAFGRWFLSTAFEGNVSRISAPATLAVARGQYVSPWSTEWEALFGEIVSQAAARYRWNKPWDTLTARELDTANYQVYTAACQVLRRNPVAWLGSHAQGMGRYLEPQTYQVCYAQFSGREWPPDILDDAVIHVLRAVGHVDWAKAAQIIAQERWAKLDLLQGTIWWGTFAGQIVGLGLLSRGAWRLRREPAVAVTLLATIGYVLWMPGPIAYERFRVPVMSLILALIGKSVSRGAQNS